MYIFQLFKALFSIYPLVAIIYLIVYLGGIGKSDDFLASNLSYAFLVIFIFEIYCFVSAGKIFLLLILVKLQKIKFLWPFNHLVGFIYTLICMLLAIGDVPRHLKRCSYKANNILCFILLTLFNCYSFSCYVTIAVLFSYPVHYVMIFSFAGLRILVDIFIFAFYDVYSPKEIKKQKIKLDKRNKRFMRCSELASLPCLGGSVCRSTDLEHVLRCHDSLSAPDTRCHPAFCCENSKYLVGFYDTSLEKALSIANMGFVAIEGKFGEAIYFARSIDKFNVSNNLSAVVCALVDKGNMAQVDFRGENEPHFKDFDSVLVIGQSQSAHGDGFVVFSPDRIKEWIIVYPTRARRITNEGSV